MSRSMDFNVHFPPKPKPKPPTFRIPGRSCETVTHGFAMTIAGLDRTVQGVIDSDIAESDIKRLDIYLDERNEFIGTVTLNNRRRVELSGRCFGR